MLYQKTKALNLVERPTNRHWARAQLNLLRAKIAADKAEQEKAQQAAAPKHKVVPRKSRFVVSRVVENEQLMLPSPDHC